MKVLRSNIMKYANTEADKAPRANIEKKKKSMS